MTTIKCDPPVLITFAQKAHGLGDQLGNLLSQMNQAKVGHEAFGRIPGIGPRIAKAYDEHVDSCVHGIEQAHTALEGVSSASGTTAALWLQNEQHVKDNVLKSGG
jgi:hypothetical protein